MSFKGKVVIVTGSSSGIGSDCAVLFAEDGASVTIHGQSNERLKETEKLLEKANVPSDRWLRVVGPIESVDTQKKLIEKTVEKFGRIDVLVNNAGLYRKNDLDPESLENFEYLVDVNLKSVVSLTRLALPHLEKTGGNVVNVSSIYGQRGTAALSNYAITKAGVEQFTRNAAIAYGKRGVRVNAVSPGAIESRFGTRDGTDPATANAAYRYFLDRTVPLNRMGKPREVSQVIWFLASDRASYVHGAVYFVDGGSSSGQF
ncbi:hypothetical protein M3Y96_01044000 [Aphelenchoides besseyi]|nr:hypothetical protein M3Y96_01044000 [Aphelenchoides besseyi]